MRSFEEDFEFKFEESVRATPTRVARIDAFRTITLGKEVFGGSEREARIAAHQERVQRELRESGELDKRSLV